MNSESYSAFHTDCIYWLVACHLPTISVVLYIVSLGFCHHLHTDNNFSEPRVDNAHHSLYCSQFLQNSIMFTISISLSISHNSRHNQGSAECKKMYRTTDWLCASPIHKSQQSCRLMTVSRPLETFLGKVVAAPHLLLLLEKGLHLLDVLISQFLEHWWIDNEFKV